jgi:hypothetical protein
VKIEEKPGADWEEFLGQDPKTLALPDYNSNYFAYSFERTTDETRNIGLRITGEFPYARYMSFNVYDGDEGTSYGSLTDFRIRALQNSVNPFVAGSNALAENRSYTVTALPEVRSNGERENEITFGEKINVLTVMLRYYVPQRNAYGGVALPKIEAFDTRTGQGVKLPPRYDLKGSKSPGVMALRLAPVFGTAGDDDTLRFYQVKGSGQFNNFDNSYLICAVEQAAGQVVLIRINPPSFPRSNNEFDKTDVRYWSFNQGNPDTSTPFGMRDDEFNRNQDGFINIAIGDEIIRGTAERRGYNFMPWKADREKSVILYRNLVTNPQFRANLARVPETTPKDLEQKNKENLPAKEAANWIGEYAPTAKKMSQALFMQGR